MENYSLSSDETIVLTTQSIVVDGIRYEGILTNRRLILFPEGDRQAPIRDISLATIGSATAGENALREPTITLSLTSPDGVLLTIQLVFIRLVSEDRNHQFDEWVRRLKERIRITIEPLSGTNAAPVQRSGERDLAVPQDLSAAKNHHDPRMMPRIPSYVFRPPHPVVRPPEANLGKILIFIIVIALCATGVLVGVRFLSIPASIPSASSPVPQALGQAPADPVTVPHQSLTPAPARTLTTVSSPQLIIPPSGIWVRIQYPGNYTGFVGALGRMREVNNTGDRFFQIPATGGIIEMEVQKMDGSGDLLAVEIYKDGGLVKRTSTTKPHGTVFFNADV